jgi:hypothetical protein
MNVNRTPTAVAAILALALGSTATLASAKQNARISEAAAQKIALAQVTNGRIKSSELENEMHRLVWSFDISQPKTRSITEILVDAYTGKIVATQHETPTQQAAETAADKADAKTPGKTHKATEASKR